MEQIKNIRLQPIMCLADNQIYGYEVLSGLDPAKNNASFFYNQNPDDQLYLRNKQMQLLQNFPLKGKLFFNLSINTLLSADHIDKLILSSTPGILELQDPENLSQLSSNDMSRLHNNIEQLSIAGFKVWLDDYQPQYMTQLERLGWVFSGVKLDCALLHNHRSSPLKFNELIDEAEDFGKMTLVEGVESPEDLFMVLKTRARFVQGFLWPEFAIPAHVNLGLPA